MPVGMAALPPNFRVLLWLYSNKKSAPQRADKRALFGFKMGAPASPRGLAGENSIRRPFRRGQTSSFARESAWTVPLVREYSKFGRRLAPFRTHPAEYRQRLIWSGG